ncbi:MAG: DegV family protein [Oscillibacter sp.]|nr:DegV family protein [Oscillibacter sp.]
MNKQIVLVAETGSDITPALAEEYGIYLVPMHVSMGNETLDDGTFPPEDVCAYYDRTGTVPKTSASVPGDFERVFDEIHSRWPEKKILHLAYSAVTTCSYQSAVMASEGRDYVTSVDTKHVSVGQASVVLEVARFLREHPDCSVEEAAAAAKSIAERTQMCFIPKNLDYLRAGGRVSNVVALTGNLLQLHPCIEILDGQLVAKKKYRGALDKLTPKLIRDFVDKHDLDRDHLYFIWSPGLQEEVRRISEQTAAECGFRKVTWMKTGCVITCHGGPGCIGIVGSSRA